MVRNGNNVSICIWYEMAMVRNGYGTKIIFTMVRKSFSLWYEMVMVRNHYNSLQLEIFYRRIWCMFLLLIDVFFLFVSVLNQLHPISISIVYISVLLVVFHMMNEG
jgi:hypothetical protein